MRIISGTARGTKLNTLEGLNTRPTLDRVKEALFNIISPIIMDSVVLDLFAGSGAIGLEFASRGAKKVYLVDNSKNAINIINTNIQKTHAENITKVLNLDFQKALNELKEQKFNIIYLDPPYNTDYIKISIDVIIKSNCLDDEGIIIIETDDYFRIVKDLQNFKIEIFDKRKYGRANLFFVRLKGKE